MRALYDVPAPAKLNLFLHITGRRADGYHLLQSVFMLIDWHDSLHLEVTQDGRITRQDLNTLAPALPADDLIVRAARALQAATGCTQGAHIALDKHIPSQAGMGGGSSDAASTLLALNRLWNLGLDRSELATIGLQLGADVPFFIGGSNAWVEGIGEQITPLEGLQALPRARFVVVKPNAGLDTPGIFSSPLLKRDTQRATIADFAANHFDFGHNDLQPVAQALCPDVEKASNWLASLGLQARMTGSGSAVFAQIKQADFSVTQPCDWTIKVCENLPSHPLKEWIADKRTTG
ncbi:4-(cytidine 5'-diphospho)-2-C-methyl-D-erythritol kinase [Comamonas sp. GB3 AK4-5]|uniref:4-(cytidine 5'-diphospho)-2-C-methyl-D-erythritol kinase n=1 Tax=Comamonas sp. GB3 AK4-5 TaxID=3231487 RepID=UPI00351E12EA